MAHRQGSLPTSRREFITRLGGAAVAWPLAARAQQPSRMRRIGVLMNGAATDVGLQSQVAPFIEALRNAGWIEGRNIHIEVRWNDGNAERAKAYAAELIGIAPDLILASSTTNLEAVLQATRTMPIVFVQVSDPVAQGFVSSLAHPGGNITGFAVYEFSIAGKWLDLLKQMEPRLKRAALVFNPETSPQSKLFLGSIEAAAASLGIEVSAIPVRDTADLEPAIAGFSRQPNGGLIFPTDQFIGLRGALVVELAARYRLPAISAYPEQVQAGGLMSYTASYNDQFPKAADYVDRILKGARPGDLPVQLPTKFTFIVNRKTASALGIDVPLGLLLAADEVIE